MTDPGRCSDSWPFKGALIVRIVHARSFIEAVKGIFLVAFILGIIGPMVLLGILNSWILPEAGLFGAILIVIISAVACTFAMVGLVKGQSLLLNFITLLASTPALLFLIIFGLGHLF